MICAFTIGSVDTAGNSQSKREPLETSAALSGAVSLLPELDTSANPTLRDTGTGGVGA